MSIIVQNGVPVFSKEKNTYVDKVEANAEAEAEIEANLTRVTVDLSDPLAMAKEVFGSPTTNSQIDEDDLPF